MFVTTHIDSDAKSRKSLEGIAVINDFTLDKNKFNALIDYTKHAVMRMLPNPIKQYESNGIKFLEIFENYRVECNKNDVLNFSIKTEMNPDAEFKSYAYHYKPVSHTMAMQDQFNDAEFMPIWNLYELMLEGAEMRHCVAAFNYHILNGVYIVFKVLYEEERATLGLTLKQTHKGQEWALAQCYGKYNQIPSDALLRKAVEFVKMINLNTSTIFKD